MRTNWEGVRGNVGYWILRGNFTRKACEKLQEVQTKERDRNRLLLAVTTLRKLPFPSLPLHLNTYRGSSVRFPAGAGNFSLHHRVQNGSGAHLASYTMGIRGSFPGGKAAGA
jgi:hypothetical protein